MFDIAIPINFGFYVVWILVMKFAPNPRATKRFYILIYRMCVYFFSYVDLPSIWNFFFGICYNMGIQHFFLLQWVSFLNTSQSMIHVLSTDLGRSSHIYQFPMGTWFCLQGSLLSLSLCLSGHYACSCTTPSQFYYDGMKCSLVNVFS